MQSLFEKLARTPERTILIFSLALLLAGNWILPLTDRDEVRFSEASREMIQRGDYIVPWFNGDYRFDKPILIYWCQIASYKLFGENGFAARLPSVLFTTGTALLLVRWGRKISGAKMALLAGGMFVAGLHVAVIGRVATADMALIFFYTLAVWSGWELSRPEQIHRARWWWIFYVALAFGFLAKGPEIYLVFLGLIFSRALRKDDFHLRLLPTVLGFVLSVGLIGLWGIPALLETHGKFFDVGIGEHVVKRALNATDNHGLAGALGYLATLPVYFLTFFISFFPWSTRVPVAAKRWWPRRHHDSPGWYLFIQTAMVFIAFSLVRTKLPHYTMPAFPCIALWLALRISGEPNSLAWFGKRAIGVAVFIAVLMLGFFSFAKYDFLTGNLWRATKQYVRPETKVGCFGFRESSLVWRFRSVSTNFVTLNEEKFAADFLTNSPPLILVVPTTDAGNLARPGDLQVRVHGLDIVKFKNWDLTAIIRQ